MNIKKISAIIACSLGFLLAGSAYADFVKYKKYLIPVGKSCSGIDDLKTNVIYMDDAGLVNEDPNGVFDALIVLAWHKQGKYNLLSIGSSTSKSDSASNQQLMQRLVSDVGMKVPVYRESALVDEVISQANRVFSCTGKRLVVSAGGEIHELKNALAKAPDIANKIKIYSIAGANYNSTRNNPSDYRFVLSKLGNANIVEICDRKDKTVAAKNCYRGKHLRYPFSSKYAKSLSDSQKRAWVDRVYRNFSSIITADFKKKTRKQNKGEGSGDHYLRVADYLTVAAFVWPNTDNIFRDYFIYGQIESAIKNL
ncbi:MAG: hypothetical protein ACRBCI_07300 [Cellvibrionaceae bacterium]